MVVGYSNALTECRDTSGQTLGLDGLVDRVRRLDPDQPAELAESLFRELHAEDSENLAGDDATVLVGRATSTTVSWKDNLLAPFRLLTQVGDKTRFAPS